MSVSTAVVTGGNRGLGLEVCRQLAERGWLVVLTARNQDHAARAAAELDVGHHQLDVTSDNSAAAFAMWLKQEYGQVHALVNNAAVHYDTGQQADRADLRVVQEAMNTNVVGAWRTSLALRPMMRSGARIVNVSSGAGSFTEVDGATGTPAYAVSKAALNMLTVKLAAHTRSAGLLVNAVCPGWVATDMGGTGGRPLGEGAAGIIWAATLPPDGPTGGFFRDRQPIPW